MDGEDPALRVQPVNPVFNLAQAVLMPIQPFRQLCDCGFGCCCHDFTTEALVELMAAGMIKGLACSTPLEGF